MSWLQQAQDVALDAWAIAELATKLEAGKCGESEVWEVLQLKHVKAGFVFNPTRVFLAKTADMRVDLLPYFREDLEDCISNALISKKRLARLLRSYAFNHPSDTFLSRQCSKLDEPRLYRLPEVLPNLYAIFWRAGNSSVKSLLEANIKRDTLEPNALFTIYLYAFRLGDGSKMNLISDFEGKIQGLNDGNMFEFGKMVLTTENFSKYKDVWLQAFPSAISKCRHKDSFINLLRLYTNLSSNLPSEVQISCLNLFKSWSQTQETHELMLLAKEVKEINEEMGRNMGEVLRESISVLPPSERDVLSLLLSEIV